MKAFNLTLILCFLFSCGQTTEEEVSDAIEEANLLLSSRQCDSALTILNAVGMQNTNKKYLDSLSTAYACKGNYSTTTFFVNDLTNLKSPDEDTAWGVLALFGTSSDMTSPTDSDFVNLQTAIDVLLYAGGNTSASSANRASIFTSSETSDLNMQAFFMILVNMGRWFQYYGDTGTTGVKGSGSGSNTCLATYTDATLILGLAGGATGSCTDVNNTGHVDIEGSARTERLCQGIVLYNNFIDTISNLTFYDPNPDSTDDDADILNGIRTVFSGVCLAASGNGVVFSTALCDARDQSVCEAQSNVDIERFSALIFETGLQ